MSWALAVLVTAGVGGVANVAGAQVAAPAPDTLAVGEWQLVPVIELRARGEYRRFLDGESEGAIVDRVRLGLDATRDALETRVVMQAAGTQGFGNAYDFAVSPGASFAGAYEAWVDGHTDSVHPSYLRAGRQAIRWGEGRLLGTSDWSAHGRTLDAVRGRLVAGDGAFELLAAVLQDDETGTLQHPYGELLGARAEWAFDPLFAVELYGLARIAQSAPTVGSYLSFDNASYAVTGQTYTGAVRVHGDASPWAWGAEGAYQLGHSDGLQATRAAGAAAGHLAFTFERVAGAPTLHVGGAYASGETSGVRGATHTAFDPLLPDVHTWHGAMDLFSWANEVEGSARITVAPWTDALVSVEYRYARLAQPGGSWQSAYLVTLGRAPGNTDANLGSEVDASLRWSPWSPLALDAGYSVLFIGGGARAAFIAATLEPSGRAGLARAGVSVPDLSHFAYAQATLLFR